MEIEVYIIIEELVEYVCAAGLVAVALAALSTYKKYEVGQVIMPKSAEEINNKDVGPQPPVYSHEYRMRHGSGRLPPGIRRDQT